MADNPDPQADAGLSTPAVSPLTVILRRWPLLAVGLAAGALLGVLIQMSSTRIYQSTAQLLVVKKRAETVGTLERGSSADDYVGAQITIIKSEQVRRFAAQELRKMQVVEPLPADDGVLAAMIGGGLEVSRDRESAVPGTIGNGIVNVSFKWPQARDAQTYLEAVVKAYQGVLTNVYASSAQAQIELARSAINADRVKLKELAEKRIELEQERDHITNEDPTSIRARITANKATLSQVALELLEVTYQLKVASQAGPNRRDRLDALARISINPRRPTEESTESQLRAKKIARESRSKTLGPDHAEIRELDSEITFLQGELARLNPNDPTGTFDELAAFVKNAELRQTVLTQKQNKVEKDLNTDQKELIQAGSVNSQLRVNENNIEIVNKDLSALDQSVRSSEVAAGAGGYVANAVTPPGVGAQIAPKLPQSILLGLAAGMALGGAAVGVAELTDRSFKSPAEIRRVLGVPVIGHIPQLARAEVDPNDVTTSLVCMLRPKSMEAEAYRGVRTQLYFSTQGRGHQVIQLTSPNPGDGKSTLAANLAVTIAQSGKSVVLMDCDFRKPRVHKIFGIDQVESGLSSVVAGTATVAKALRRSKVENLDLMPCGPRPENPAELLTSRRFGELLGELRESYDFVLVDTPPMLAVTDPGAVAPQVDGVIMVFRMSKAARPAAEETRGQLAALGANVLGVVVNGSGSGGGGYGSYNYGTNYGYTYKAYEYAEGYADDDADAKAQAVAAR